MMLTSLLKFPLLSIICSQQKKIAMLTKMTEDMYGTIDEQLHIIEKYQQKEREWYQKLFGEEKDI